MAMAESIFRFLFFFVNPTDAYISKVHRQFANFLVWLITVIVASVTPIAFLFALPATLIFPPLGLWYLSEVVFYLYCRRLQQKFNRTRRVPTAEDLEDRKEYTRRFVDQCGDLWQALLRWHPFDDPEDVGRECAEEWYSGIMYDKYRKEMTPEEVAEMEKFQEEIISKWPRIGKPAAKVKFRPIRFITDDLKVQHKPLIFMVGVAVIQFFGAKLFLWLGFKHHNLTLTNGCTTLSYYRYHPRHIRHLNHSNSQPPIFFAHGMGIGISMYFNLIRRIIRKDRSRPIYIINFPHVSLQIMEQVPSMEDILEAVDQIYARHRLASTGCSWLAHSYGTFVTAYVMKKRPEYISNLTLVDPICFALWEGGVMYNLWYRDPPGPIHRLVQFLLAQDLLVAFTVFRNFSWSQCILFPQDIVCPARIYLANLDFIVDAAPVYSYLVKNFNVISGEPWPWPVEVVKMEKLSHGSFMYSRKWMKQITEQL